MVRTLVLAAAFLALMLPSASYAAPKDDVAAATVNVYCTYKSGNKMFATTGSGFFIDAKGIIVTNAHVAAPFLITDKKGKPASSCAIRTGSPAKATYEAELVYLSPDWITENVDELRKGRPKGTGEADVALLRVTKAIKGTLPVFFPAIPIALTGNVAEGDELIATGYPADKLSYKQVRSKLVRAVAAPELSSVRYFVRPYADVLIVTPSALSASGSSGGPIANALGQAIGITTAVSNEEKAKERSLRAITFNYVDRFLMLETGKPLSLLLLDPGALKALTEASLSPELRKELSAALLKRK